MCLQCHTFAMRYNKITGCTVFVFHFAIKESEAYGNRVPFGNKTFFKYQKYTTVSVVKKKW